MFSTSDSTGNRAQCRLTALIELNMLTTTLHHQLD